MIKNGTNLPRAMSWTLLDSKKNEIESELVQFSHSYEVCTPGSLSDNALTSMSNLDQEAVLSALGAFPQHLKEDIPRENISLKYHIGKSHRIDSSVYRSCTMYRYNGAVGPHGVGRTYTVGCGIGY